MTIVIIKYTWSKNLSNNKLETRLQAFTEEKSKYEKAFQEACKDLDERKCKGYESMPFQEACNNLYGCELEIEKLKTRMMRYKKYSNINFPRSTLLHVTDFPDE